MSLAAFAQFAVTNTRTVTVVPGANLPTLAFSIGPVPVTIGKPFIDLPYLSEMAQESHNHSRLEICREKHGILNITLVSINLSL